MHTANTSGGELLPLPMRRRPLAEQAGSQYRIVGQDGTLLKIMANSAYEAFKISGLKSALKIERVFNFETAVLQKARFTDDTVQEAEKNAEDDAAKARQRLIVSADELDSMIRSLQDMSEQPDILLYRLADGKAPTPHFSSASSVAFQVPDVPASTIAGDSPIGTEVHGDGFDEIIPSAMQAKVAPPKPAEKTVTATAGDDPVDAPPERELTAAEIETLLGGK